MKTFALLLALAAAIASHARTPAPSTPGAPAGEELSGSYAADAVHSSVVFSTMHMGVVPFWGRFNTVSADIQFNEKDIAQSHVSVEIPADSIDTNNEKRDGHLKSPDFFSAKEFPLITFESKSVKGKKDALEITGDLTLHGVTKSITAKGRCTGSGSSPFGDFRAGFEARFTFKPADFGFAFMKNDPEALGPDVDVVISLECVQEQQ